MPSEPSQPSEEELADADASEADDDHLMKCEACNGTGCSYETHFMRCEDCGGSGKLEA